MTGPANRLKAAAGAARDWLFDHALPLWATDGFDACAGLFREALDADGAPVDAPLRCRVQARQTYVYAEAGRLGWTGDWRGPVQAGLACLLQASRAPSGAMGHRLDAAGSLTDARWDLYDQAFALFALANARIVAPEAVDARVAEIVAFLDTRRGLAGGYLEGEVQPSPRRQNPHMHLFEAGLALAGAGSRHGPALADEMAGLFARFFFDPGHGGLGEFYDDELNRAGGEAGRIAEPGHHFEWVWLLDRYARSGGRPPAGAGACLWDHAAQHGLNAGEVAIDEVWLEGGARARTARLWPQTERLKAALVLFEATGEDRFLSAALSAITGLDRFIAPAKPGLWIDRLDDDLTPLMGPAPASSFYHLMVALSELIRVADGL